MGRCGKLLRRVVARRRRRVGSGSGEGRDGGCVGSVGGVACRRVAARLGGRRACSCGGEVSLGLGFGRGWFMQDLILGAPDLSLEGGGVVLSSDEDSISSRRTASHDEPPSQACCC